MGKQVKKQVEPTKTKTSPNSATTFRPGVSLIIVVSCFLLLLVLASIMSVTLLGYYPAVFTLLGAYLDPFVVKTASSSSSFLETSKTNSTKGHLVEDICPGREKWVNHLKSVGKLLTPVIQHGKSLEDNQLEKLYKHSSCWSKLLSWNHLDTMSICADYYSEQGMRNMRAALHKSNSSWVVSVGSMEGGYESYFDFLETTRNGWCDRKEKDIDQKKEDAKNNGNSFIWNAFLKLGRGGSRVSLKTACFSMDNGVKQLRKFFAKIGPMVLKAIEEDKKYQYCTTMGCQKRLPQPLSSESGSGDGGEGDKKDKK